jgi:hypothetical protein
VLLHGPVGTAAAPYSTIEANLNKTIQVSRPDMRAPSVQLVYKRRRNTREDTGTQAQTHKNAGAQKKQNRDNSWHGVSGQTPQVAGLVSAAFHNIADSVEEAAVV